MVTAAYISLAFLVVLGGLAGCLDEPAGPAQAEPVPPESNPRMLWESNETGDLTYSARLELPAGARCFATLLGRGTASGSGPVIALVISGVDEWRSDFMMNVRTSDAPDLGHPIVGAGVAGVNISSDATTYQAMWVHNVSAEFATQEEVHLFALVRNADPAATSQYASNADLANLTGSASLQLWCPHIDVIERVDVPNFLLFDMRQMSEGTFVRAQTTSSMHLATVALDHGFAYDTGHDTLLFATVGPDPEKVARIVLQGPDGVHEWFAPPTTYMLQVGDVDLAHEGRPGKYRLTLDGMGATGFFQFIGVLIELRTTS